MSGAEVCNLMDSLAKRNIPDSDIIEIVFETEGRQRNYVPDGKSKAEPASGESR